jgi:DNA modification methylase
LGQITGINKRTDIRMSKGTDEGVSARKTHENGQKKGFIKVIDIKLNDTNPRYITEDKFKQLVNSVSNFPKMMRLRPITLNNREEKLILGGNMRYRALLELGYVEIPAEWVQYAEDLTEEEIKRFIIEDNVGFGQWDWDALANDWDAAMLAEWGLDFPAPETNPEPTEKHDLLTDTFTVPPFSVLDTRQGYWQVRKDHWRQLIQDNGESREHTLAKGGMMEAVNSGVSILDPVLAEVVNKWFGLPECKTFDPFAGDSVFGYVSAYLGNTFTGIELRKEQADLNNARVAGMRARYVCDDGQNVSKHVERESQDLLFSCPPYFDLEVYSNLPNDASNQKEYKAFLSILETAFAGALGCLKNNRFAVITVGDIRDEKGYYRRFIDDIANIMANNGAGLYNELILVESIGTLPQRVGKFMEHRKIGKCHQNVLVFYKGDPKQIKKIYPKLTIQIEDESAGT